MTGRKILDTTATVLDMLFIPAVNSTVAYLAHNGIQDVRAETTSSKNTEENFVWISSITNALSISYAGMKLFSSMLKNSAYTLSRGQFALVFVCDLLACGTAGYSLSYFADTDHLLAAGISASASALLFNTARNATSFFATQARNAEEARLAEIAKHAERAALVEEIRRSDVGRSVPESGTEGGRYLILSPTDEDIVRQLTAEERNTAQERYTV